MAKTERWAIVLGASSGAGAAISRALAVDPGLNIFAVHRGNHLDEAKRVRADVEAAGVRYHERLDEAGKADFISQVAAEIAETVADGKVQIFVHSIANASVGTLAVGGSLLHPKQINKTFDSMAHSFVYWVRELIQRDLMAPEGRFLALTNAIVESNLANCSAIAAAKAALEMYVKYLAMELGPKGLRVNALRFSTAETAALKWIFPDGDWDKVRDFHHQMSPSGRMIQLDEVGKLTSVLAGDAGAWFNGAVIDFTGGQMHSLYQRIMDKMTGEEASDGGVG